MWNEVNTGVIFSDGVISKNQGDDVAPVHPILISDQTHHK
jgi:hypothetical protein